MSRRLAPDEQALWALVAATVKPLHPARQAEPPASPPLPHSLNKVDRARIGPMKASPMKAGPQKPHPLPAAPPPAARPHPESLDAGWDKRLASGKLVPDLVIDLHGLRREEARRQLYDRVADAEHRGLRILLVITGKGHNPGPSPADLMEGRPARGAIRADLPRWLGEDGLSTRIAAVRRAHPRHGGAGAAYLILKRRRG